MKNTIIKSILAIIFGIALGVLSKWVNVIPENNLIKYFDWISTGIIIWLVIGSYLIIKSKDRKELNIVYSLYDCEINVNNICIVRYPSINRIDQMFLDNPPTVDYNLFFNYIYVLCFSSPYSWKDNAWKQENGDVDYTDSLGVFDLNRKKIIECLIKNHDFNEQSEVGEFKRRALK